MEPAEEIATSWLQRKGYFTMNGVKVGYYNKEIDVLAIHPKTGDKLHVEVHVSISPAGALRAWGSKKYSSEALPKRITDFYRSKFVGAVDKQTRKLKNHCVRDKVEELFGPGEYRKVLVVGNLHKDDPEEELRKEFEKHDVELKPLGVILKEVLENMKGVYMDTAKRYVQILSEFLQSVSE